VTTPLPVESPGAPVIEGTVLPPTTSSDPVGDLVLYAINDTGRYVLAAQGETNILRLYNAETGDAVQAVGDSATYTALTASCNASINPNMVG